MPRSNKEQTEASHKRIVDAAGRLFRDRGFDAVAIADIMKAAGMTQGGFYKHFGSKEALAAETLADSFGGAASQWRSSSTAPQPTRSLMDSYFSEAPAEYRCPMLAFGEEVARTSHDSDLRDAYIEGARTLHDIFVRPDLDNARAEGNNLLFAAMIGVGLLLRVGRAEDWVQEMAAAVRNDADRLVGHLTDNSDRIQSPLVSIPSRKV